MLDKIVDGLAREGVFGPARRAAKQERVPDDPRTAGRRIPARLAERVIALLRFDGRENPGITRGHHHPRIRRRHVRVPAEITILEYVMPKWIAVLHAEPMAPGIARPSELRRT